jgi:hypothetical protein
LKLDSIASTATTNIIARPLKEAKTIFTTGDNNIGMAKRIPPKCTTLKPK